MFLEFIKAMSESGVKLPFAYDAATKQPSVTLFFMWLANALAILSLIYLHIRGDALVATSATCLYAVICTVLYMIRKLHHAKIDLDDRSIDLESDDEQTK